MKKVDKEQPNRGIDLNREYAPHQQRVVDEAKELMTKIEALTAFTLNNPTFETLAPTEQSRLRRQLIVMIDYHDILEERIINF